MKLVTAALGLVVVLGVAACGSTTTVPAPTLGAAAAPVAERPSPSAEAIAKSMGIANVTAYTAADDPDHLLGRQNGYTSKVKWTVGEIEVFPTVALAQARKAYISGFGAPFGDGYDYVDGTALLRLVYAVTPTQAKANETLFDRAAG